MNTVQDAVELIEKYTRIWNELCDVASDITDYDGKEKVNISVEAFKTCKTLIFKKISELSKLELKEEGSLI